MTKTNNLNILRIVLTWLWRVVLTAAALCGLCVLGAALVLNLVFNGPSPTARNQLALTLLDSEQTCSIPGRFLSEETIAQISSGVGSPAGSNDPALIQPSSTGEDQAFTHTLDGFTAQVQILSRVHLVGPNADDSSSPQGDPVIRAADLWNGERYLGQNAEGILLISDDPQAMDGAVRCGHVLILDGQVNESLFAAHSSIGPRAAIGQTADGAIIFITTDGWTREHLGATYQDMINLMTHYGAVNACLLDQSATAETTTEKEG